MKDLIGFECACEFLMESHQWPIEGSPAWVVIEAVDMPMVCMRRKFGGGLLWLNASLIKSIRPVGPANKN